MRVLVTGATGFIGSHLVEALLQQGIKVSACARNVEALNFRFGRVRAVQMDFTQPLSPGEWLNHLRDVDVVINTVGIIAESGSQTFAALHEEFPRMLFKACEAAGIRRVIQLSALGAEANAGTAYFRSKHAADTYLRSLLITNKIVVKPSFVYGTGGKSIEFFRALAAQPIRVLIDGGKQLVQPIHIADLVEAIAKLTTIENPPTELVAVGPAPMTFREMLAGYRRWLGFDPTGSGKLPSISLPSWLVILCARLFGFLRNPYLNADNIRMLAKGNAADPGQITALLGTPPAAFNAALVKIRVTDADRWHARLYFLLPALRLAIAFVWIYTGIISAFVYPREASYDLLRTVGLSGWMLPASLYGAALLDIALGIAVLRHYRVHLVGVIQLVLILGYTVIISVFLPEFWLHPFGPLIKNLPMMLAILVLMAVERGPNS